MNMTKENKISDEVTEQDLEALDANLLEIEILYRSRCVNVPTGSNVVVREIEKKDE